MSAECRKCGHDLVRTIDDDYHCNYCENKKLKARLSRAVEALECGLDMIAQLKDQRCILPGEVDTFEEKARACLASIKGEGE